MSATFTTKPELLLSRNSRGYTADLNSKPYRVTDAAGKVLGVLKGKSLSLQEVLAQLSQEHPEVTPAEAKLGLLELLRIGLVDQNIVVDAPRWTHANRPDNRLAPPTIAPVLPQAARKVATRKVATRKVAAAVATRAELNAPVDAHNKNYIPTEPRVSVPNRQEQKPPARTSPVALAILSFSLTMLMGLPIWRAILKPMAQGQAMASLQTPRR